MCVMRYVPSSFDPNDADMRAITIAADWNWPTCAQALKKSGSVGVMMRLPLFWQLEVPLFHACKEAGAFLFVCEPQNMPFGAAALRDASIDTVVTDLNDALAFAQFLAARPQPLPPNWLIIRRADQQEALPVAFASVHVVEESHSSPGVLQAV